jgi:isoleucyl-tRNA synthetase
MDTLRTLVTLGRAARNAARVRTRQPLPAVLIATPDRGLRDRPELVDLLADELNVKAVRFVDDASAYVRYEVKPRFDRLGPKHGGRVQAVAAALRALPPGAVVAAQAAGQPLAVAVGGEQVRVEPDEVDLRLHTAAGYAAEGAGSHVVVLETTVDETLVREGRARELVHHIQQMRKALGLDVSDRIVLYLDGDEALQPILDAHGAYLMAETLSTGIRRGAAGRGGARDVALDGMKAIVAVERA